MTKTKKILNKTVAILIFLFIAILATSLVACAPKKNDFYSKPATWHGVDGNLEIYFDTSSSSDISGANLTAILKINEKTVKIGLYTSDNAQTFGMYKKVEEEANEWLGTNPVKCICNGDYTFKNDIVTFKILYDFSGLEGENALLGKNLVCQKIYFDKSEDYYNQPATWYGEEVNLLIDFKTASSENPSKKSLIGKLTICGKEVEVIIDFNSTNSLNFGISKRKTDQSTEWLGTRQDRCICSGRYTIKNDEIKFIVFYDYSGLKGDDALLGKVIVCHKQEITNGNLNQNGGVYEK